MKLDKNTLNASFTNAPQGFDAAMRRAFTQIHQKEISIQQPHRYARRLSFGLVALIVLLIAAIAVAATLLSHNVFEITMGATPENAASLTQYNLASQSFEHCDIKIKEAAYDGMSLYVVYSIRDRNAAGLLGEVDEYGIRRLSDDGIAALDAAMAQDNIGWWWDNLWIDGKSVNMPSMSGGDTIAGEEPGEALYYMMYRLDQEQLYLDGQNVEISLPIGKKQPMESLVYNDATGQLEKPADGLVSFRLDCSIRTNTVTETPNLLTNAARWDAKVSKVVYTPIQMYVTLDWSIHQEVLDAYIAEHGDGFYQDGVKYWDYDGLEICGHEIMSMELVTKDGEPVFETMEGFYGCGGCENTQAWYTFPYLESYPDEMWLAPTVSGEVDMAQAVRVK